MVVKPPELAQIYGYPTGTPPMLVLRKPSVSQLAQSHVPPAGVITTGVTTQKNLQNNSKHLKPQSSVITPDDGVCWVRSEDI